MLKKRYFLLLVFLLVGTTFISCSKFYDMRLDSLEKSIDNLDQSYDDYSPDKLLKQIESCEKLYEELSQNETKLTDNQRKRLAKLKGKYHRVLLTIKIWSLTQTLSDESEQVLEYVKGILGD